MTRTLALLTSVAALGLLAGCGDDDSSSTSAAPPAQNAPAETTPAEAPAPAGEPAGAPAADGDAVQVNMEGIQFVPQAITAKVGQEIVWTNGEPIVHNVVAEDGADFESEAMEEGDTFSYTPTEPGTINYVCTFHPGQDGTIAVEG